MQTGRIIPVSGNRPPRAVSGTCPCLGSPGPPGSCCNSQENELLQAPPPHPQCVPSPRSALPCPSLCPILLSQRDYSSSLGDSSAWIFARCPKSQSSSLNPVPFLAEDSHLLACSFPVPGAYCKCCQSLQLLLEESPAHRLVFEVL